MKPRVLLFSLLLATPLAGAIELRPIGHKTIADNRTYVREATDRRYSVWTDDTQKANELLRSFGFQKDRFTLKKGEVLVVFLNDSITEDLIQIIHNKTARQVFADYAESGVEFQLKALQNGKKYSHATAVVFTVRDMPSHIGIRGMIAGALSEKK
jgi:hypothetical protein